MKNAVFVTFSGNVNGATLKRKSMKGKDYLVGPVIMAREIVMNGLLYPGAELKAGVPHWNGCPAVLGHPKDDQGNFLSANSPDIIEEVGVGFVYNTRYDEEKRLASELWIEEDCLSTHTDLKEALDNGEVIEVSTGLYYTPAKGTGTFKNRKYKAIATNHKPDHLAILLNEKGACSVSDGAGFPRANVSEEEQLEVNALSGGEITAIVSKALKKTYKQNGSAPWLVDIYPTENYVVYELFNGQIESYELFKVSYKVNEDETDVTFEGAPKKVICKKNYVDIGDETVLKQNSQDGGATVVTAQKPSDDSTTQNGETTMNKSQVIAKLLASNKIDAQQAKLLEGMPDDQFAVYSTFLPKDEPLTPPVTEPAKNQATPPVQTAPVQTATVPATNGDKDATAWMQAQYASRREACITQITANKSNTFTKAELEGMPIGSLEKMASLATANSVDMAGAKGTVPAPSTAKNAEESAEEPYVMPE